MSELDAGERNDEDQFDDDDDDDISESVSVENTSNPNSHNNSHRQTPTVKNMRASVATLAKLIASAINSTSSWQFEEAPSVLWYRSKTTVAPGLTRFIIDLGFGHPCGVLR